MEIFDSLFKRVRCDGCSKSFHGAKYRCMKCDGSIFCKRCQEGGIHSHHTIVPFTDSNRSRSRPIPSPPSDNRTTPHDSPDPKSKSQWYYPNGIIPVAPPVPGCRKDEAKPSPGLKSKPQSDEAVRRRRKNIVVLPPGPKSQSPYPCGKAPVAPPVPRPQKGMKAEHDAFTAKWAPARSDAPFRRVLLSESDPEFQAVVQNMKQMGGKSFTSKVVQICRIENYRLYRTYKSCREDMTRVNDPGTVNERTLWHGTGADVLSNIYRDGFNRSYCGKNATAYGNGVYFATSFDYSASPKYSPPDAYGQKYIFQCLVLTGNFIQGKRGLKEPPMRDEEFRYDSVVDDVSAPKMFVVFKDMQVYPEYVITLDL